MIFGCVVIVLIFFFIKIIILLIIKKNNTTNTNGLGLDDRKIRSRIRSESYLLLQE